MENYEQKYKEALEWMRSIYPTMQGAEKEDAKHFFPELKESEDERIKREILELVSISGNGNQFEEIKDWLEKQGEKSPKARFKVGDKVIWIRDSRAIVRTISEVSKSNTYWLDCPGSSSGWYSDDELEPYTEQGEQKPADKIEPKFKVGDWITNGEYTWNVTDIKPLDYLLQAQNGDVVDDTISYVDEEFHLWTIQDVKDGDVLANGDVNMVLIFKCFAEPSYRQHIIAHIGLDTSGDIQVTDGYWNLGFNCRKPATKEQCDLLFQKMKEAGYEWDAEKKELKKIEQKSAWSEEDEKMIEDIIEAIDKQYAVSDYNEMVSWLKSIKPNHWKPSEEQMEALETAIRCRTMPWEQLGTLYNELKNL